MIQGTSLVIPRCVVQPAVTGPIWEIMTGPTDYINILSVRISITSGVNIGLGLGFGVPAAAGISPGVNSFIPLADDPAVSIGGLSFANAWRIAPTSPARFLRRFTANCSSNAVVGPLVISFDGGRLMAPSSSFVLWATTTSSTASAATQTIIDSEVEISQ